MFKRVLLTLSLMVLAPLIACAEEATSYEAGKHYDVISPAIRTAASTSRLRASAPWLKTSACARNFRVP